MRRFFSHLFIMMVGCMLFAGASAALAGSDDHGNGHGNGRGNGKSHERAYDHGRHAGDQEETSSIVIVPPASFPPAVGGVQPLPPVVSPYHFGGDDRVVIISWREKNPRHGWGKMPPGLEKKIRSHGWVRPGQKVVVLPPDLDRRMGPPPDGHIRVAVDRDVFLVALATGMIVDVMRDVF